MMTPNLFVKAKRAVGLALALACLGASVTAALAHSGGAMPKPFLHRHAVMTSLAVHLKAAKAALDAKDMKTLAAQADAMHWLARIVPDAFPKGSGPEMGHTRASPQIWEDWTGFTAAAGTLAESSAALKAAATSNDSGAAEKAFGVLGRQGCGGCHKLYRTAKQ